MRKRFTAACLSILFALFSITGCTDSNPADPYNSEKPPVLPSTSTMMMDISVFESAQLDMQSIREGSLSASSLASRYHTRLNFLNAAVRALFLQIVVYAALIEPVAAFEVAIHSVPQPQSDGSWLWTYIFVSETAEYNIYLTGKQKGSYVDWKMEVSSTDISMPLDHFLWFEGETQNDGSCGYWQFYEPAGGGPASALAHTNSYLQTPGVPCIRIDWENPASDEHHLVFLVNKEGIPEEGSTLAFHASPSMSSIDFYGASQDASGNITWYPDGSGSIQWPDYNNGIKSCWDILKRDTVCP